MFEDYRNGLTVGELRKLLEQLPDDMAVCVKTLIEYFPANKVTKSTYNLYPFGCDGVPQGTKECIKIG